MKQSLSWHQELKAYLVREGTSQCEQARLWMAAIGLQGVDHLQPSDFMVTLVKKNIEGKLSLSSLDQKLRRHYRWHRRSPELSKETWEADLVSLHIMDLLGKSSFQLAPSELKRIHHHLFKDVYSFAGDFRDYEIRKNEPVLEGKSVCYTPSSQIRRALHFCFSQEQAFSYQGLDPAAQMHHLADFIRCIWLIHPYGEGNTRTTAVFMLQYLKLLKIPFSAEVFAGSAWYFRNALVRANYHDLENGIVPTAEYLEKFMENLLFGQDHLLVSRHLAIDYNG